MLNKKIKSASIVIIGNEILSGRTQDKNINYIAKELFKSGVLLKYVCVIPDEKKIIVEWYLESYIEGNANIEVLWLN